MDLSLFERSRDAIAAPRLDYATLIAALAGARASADPIPAAREVEPHPPATALACLVTVFLGRRGWQRAARALGGGFAAAEKHQPL